MTALQVLVYVSLGVFVAAVIARALRYRLTPVHMRWELYPVAHERGRHHYGGSRFEELDWWTHESKKDRLNELSEMLQEIFLLKGVWLNNRPLWFLSFPFHVGFYVCTLWVLLLLLVGTLEIAGVPPVGAASTALTAALAATGYGGFALVALGALGLLARRIGSPGLRKYSGVPEYLNLVVVFSVALSVVAIQATRDPLFATTCAFVTSLMAFRPQPADMGLAQMVEMGLGAFLVAYVPLTRMSHFVAKYFLYHDVRWHDEPNRPGSRIEARVKQALDFGVSWDAPHIPKNKKWGQVVTESER